MSRKINFEKEKEIIELYKAGNSIRTTAEKAKVGVQTVINVFNRYGITRRTYSEAQKLVLQSGRVKHPTKGGHRKETKEKISDSCLKHWESLGQEGRDIHSAMLKRSWKKKDPLFIANFRYNGNVGRIKTRREGSKCEKALAVALQIDQFRIEYHRKHLIGDNEMEIDILLPDHGIAIEVDGMTHFSSELYGPEALKKVQKKDEVKNKKLIANGYKVIRILYKMKHFSKGRLTLFYKNELLPLLQKVIKAKNCKVYYINHEVPNAS